jgi:glutamate dehydrogenase
VAAGVPPELARSSAVWKLIHTGFDLVEIAGTLRVPIELVADTYWAVFDRLELMWLWDGIGALPRSDRWQTQARSALRDDLMAALSDLTATVVSESGGSTATWVAANERSVSRVMAMFTEIRRAEVYDITNLSVALRQLRNLGLVTVGER